MLKTPESRKFQISLINDPDATFPTNLVLHIPMEIIKENKKNGNFVEIELDNKVFKEIKEESGDVYITIIDGQHRIRGIELAISNLKGKIKDLLITLRGIQNEELEEKLKYYQTRLNDLNNIELVVSFFIDKTLEYQAMVFSTINRTQKKVSADLVSSLFGLNTGDTPQKTALQIVLSLNGHESSPFYKRIKLYGGSYSKQISPPLSQSAMVNSITKLICENLREAENDRYKKRKELLKRSEKSKVDLPFRNYYARDEDEKISDIMFYFFSNIKSTFLDSKNNSYWNIDNGVVMPNILHTTVGYNALMKILVEIIKYSWSSNLDMDEHFKMLLSKVKKIEINDINRYSFNNRGG